MPDSKKVWLLGLADLKEELESHGFECHGLGPAFGDIRFDNPGSHITMPEIDEWELDPEIRAVVCGSCRELNFSKIAITSLYL